MRFQMKGLIFAIAISVCFQTLADSYSIYIVRHAEKQLEGSDPKLTPCGHERAKQLAKLLTPANITQVYSTTYQRTLSTAQPTAKKAGVALKHYSPRGQDQLVRVLKQEKKNTLVVGHSNTVPELLTLLAGSRMTQGKAKVPNTIDEKEFHHLFQVTFTDNGDVISHHWHQPLSCQ